MMDSTRTTELPLKSTIGELIVNTDTGLGMETGRIPIDAATLQIKSVIDEIDGEVSVLSFGADPTGVTNSSGAFQAAMAAIGSWGKVNVPAGTYKLDDALTGNALWNVAHGVTIAGAHPDLPGVVMSRPNGRDLWSGALQGSGSGEQYFNSEIFTSDSFQNPAGNTYARFVKLIGRDPTSSGGRFAFGALAHLNSPGDITMAPGTNFYCGLFGQFIGDYDNSASGAAVEPSGYALNSNIVLLPNCANWGQAVSLESDVTTYAGSDYYARHALALVFTGNGPKGTIRDSGIVFIAIPGTTGAQDFIRFDNLSGGAPIATDGSVLRSVGAMTIGSGIDLSSCAIADYFLRGPGFSVEGDGDVLGKGFSSKSDFLLVKETAPANQHFARWTLDANGYPTLQTLSDLLETDNWVQFTRSGGTASAAVFAKKVYTPASASLAGLNVAPGSAPSVLTQDGDVWLTMADVFARVNGQTNTFGNLERAQTFSGIKTFSAAPIFSSMTGYVKGNGASALTAAATIPSADFADGNTGTGAVAHATSPAFSGNTTCPTQPPGDNSTKLANTAYADANLVAVGGIYAKQTAVQVFTSSGIYTPTSGMKVATVYAFGAGGGGGSGARAAAGAAAGGGAGGGGGGLAQAWFTAAQIGASKTVTIGAPGNGGSAQNVDSTAGVNGTAGGSTSLDTLLFAGGGGGGQGGGLAASSGGGGAGNSIASGTSGSGGTGGVGSFNLGNGHGNGGSGVAAINNSTLVGSGGGGSGSPAAGTGGLNGAFCNALFGGGSGGASGAGITSANAASNGGVGGVVYSGGVAQFGAAGTVGVGGGQNGGAGPTFAISVGPLNQAAAGGGGGASNLSVNSGNGGVGGLGGGGGGGGGASRNGGDSGAGGAGGAGLLIVVEQF